MVFFASIRVRYKLKIKMGEYMARKITKQEALDKIQEAMDLLDDVIDREEFTLKDSNQLNDLLMEWEDRLNS